MSTNHQHCYWLILKMKQKSYCCMHWNIRTKILCQAAKCQSVLFVAIKTASCPLSVTLQWKWLSTLTLKRHSLTHMSDYPKFACIKMTYYAGKEMDSISVKITNTNIAKITVKICPDVLYNQFYFSQKKTLFSLALRLLLACHCSSVTGLAWRHVSFELFWGVSQ